MTDRKYAYIVSRTLENKIAFAENNDQNTLLVTLDVLKDILALLKEQEAKRPVLHEKNGYWNYVCPTCGSRDEELFYEWNYCPFCGRAVKWE